jgi:hypothetical protein
MRVAFALAAGLLWAGAAYAQTPEASGPEPTASQAQSPTTNTGSGGQTDVSAGDGVTVQAAPADREHEVVCRTTLATGSRLAGRGHGLRVCKTRQQWEMEEADLQRRIGMANRDTFNASGQPQGPH